MLIDHIYQGNCIDIMSSLPEQSVDLIFADPPYNLQLRTELYRPDMSRVAAVDDAWDQFGSLEEYDTFTRAWLGAARRILKDSGTIWVIGSYHNIYRVGAIMQELGFWVLNDVVWQKSNPMPNFRGVRFTNAHETLLWCKKSQQQKKYTFNYHTMKHMNDDKQMRSVWEMPICTGSERIVVNGEKLHSTQKPEALLYRVLMASSNPGDLVLDPFFGSGTTGAVARKLGRHYIGIEQQQHYIEAARQRISALPDPVNNAEVLGKTMSKRTAPRVSFASLLEQGLLLPGQQLFFRKNPQQSATVLADGRLRLPDGHMGSIHLLGALLAGQAACNGWEHWYYEDAQGQLELIDVLREQVRAEIMP